MFSILTSRAIVAPALPSVATVTSGIAGFELEPCLLLAVGVLACITAALVMRFIQSVATVGDSLLVIAAGIAVELATFTAFQLSVPSDNILYILGLATGVTGAFLGIMMLAVGAHKLIIAVK